MLGTITTNDRRTVMLNFRVTPGEYEVIRRMMGTLHLSSFLRARVLAQGTQGTGHE